MTLSNKSGNENKMETNVSQNVAKVPGHTERGSTTACTERRPGRKVLDGRPEMLIRGTTASILVKVNEALLVVLSHEVMEATTVWVPAWEKKGGVPSSG